MDLPIKITDILKNKLKPQIEAMGFTTEEEVEAYVNDYMESAGSEFQTSLQNQVDGVKSQFEGVVQKTVTLSTTLVSIPTIMANPMTVAVANQTLQEVIGNSKSLIQEISGIMASVMALIGGVPSIMNTLQDKASETQSQAQSQLVLIKYRYNNVDQEANPNDGMTYTCNSSQTSNSINFSIQEPGYSVRFMGDIPFGNVYYSTDADMNYTVARWTFNYNEVPSGTSEYQIQVSYREEDLDELGNTEYIENTRTYYGKVIK